MSAAAAHTLLHPSTQKWPAQHPERLQLYALPTPNGVKVSIMLEETGQFTSHKTRRSATRRFSG